jgi:hypothetical protein
MDKARKKRRWRRHAMALPAVCLMAATSCSSDGDARIVTYRVIDPSSIQVEIEECAERMTADVTETPDEVQIAARFLDRDDADCATGMVIELDEPLGDRQVFDVTSARYVEAGN